MSLPLLPVTFKPDHKSASAQAIISANLLKGISLFLLIVQNSILVLLMKGSRTNHHDQHGKEKPMYITSSAVVMNEVLKMIFCVLIIFSGKPQSPFKLLNNLFIKKSRESKTMVIPAVLYAVQNNLLYIAISNLDAITFQITYQLKILTTALFSVYLLNRSFSANKWISLLLLTLGVIIIQVAEISHSKKNTVENQSGESYALGLVSVLLACLSSGYAGVYFEKIIKEADSNIWVRNAHLSMYCLLFSVIALVIKDMSRVLSLGFFYGYDSYTWSVIFLQAIGGLIVAAVMKYADNILKAFATSISIIVCMALSSIFFGFAITANFLLGTVVVVISVYMYNSFK